MRDKQEFYRILNEIDGRDFSDYSRIVGDFDFTRYVLKVDQVPENPEQSDIVVIVRINQAVAGFPLHTYSSPIRRTALEDFLVRKLSDHVERMARFNTEGVAVRRILVPVPGQKILPRSAIVMTDEHIEVRLGIRFAMRRGRIQSESCVDAFFSDLPELVNNALLYCNLDPAEVDGFIQLMEDADQIRQTLPTRGLVGFLAEGSLLRRLGGSDRPDYTFDQPLTIAPDLMVDVDVPNRGTVRGMGIPNGVTLILGDDFSGRNELMRAIASGIYNHVPGDGREYVISMPDLVYVPAERGRSVQKVDISAFLKDPLHPDDSFTSIHADACSAQAAATVEALEIGARVLLYDEQDSYTGFLAQDSRIVSMSGDEESRIIPLSARARQLADEMGVSVVVAGHASVAEFIPVADTILYIHDYQVRDITKEAKALEIQSSFSDIMPADLTRLVERSRWIIPSSIDPSSGREDVWITAGDDRSLQFGKYRLDLSELEQLGDASQVETIGLILNYGRQRYMDESRPMREMLDLVDRDLSTEGLECLTRDLRHDLARPRRYEIAAVLNRLPSLRISGADV